MTDEKTQPEATDRPEPVKPEPVTPQAQKSQGSINRQPDQQRAAPLRQPLFRR